MLSSLKFYFLLLLCLCIFSCKDDEEAPEYPDLHIYLNRFEEEAARKGYDLDLSGVQAVYVDEIIKSDGSTPCGIATRNLSGKGVKRIEISKSSDCNWLQNSETAREILFFHEIGHTFLGRPHEETKLCDGTPSTLMSSNVDPDRFYNEAEVDKRDYYISELINRLAANEKCIDFEKDWSKDQLFYRIEQTDKDWTFYSDNGNYTGKRKETIDLSGNEFLTIAAGTESRAEGTGYWFKEIEVPNIPECAKVTFRAKMNSGQLNGGGAAIALRAYETIIEREGAKLQEYLFLSTEDRPVSGKLENHTEELVIPCFSRKTSDFIIFMVMMPGTVGEVSFEDIEILVEEN